MTITVYKDDMAGPRGDGWVYAGNAEPKYTMGWRNDFYWNGFSLGFLINARIGGRACIDDPGLHGCLWNIAYFGYRPR